MFQIAHIIQLKAKLTHLDISCIYFTKKAGDTLLAAVRDNSELLQLECRECSFTESQEMWLRLLIERNNFYLNNPCMVKDTFSKEDEIEIEKWLMRVK